MNQYGSPVIGDTAGNTLEPLLTAAEVAAYLRVSPKRVYKLPIAQVRISDKRLRWLASDVVAYMRRSRRGL